MQEIIRLDLGGVNAYLLVVENGFVLIDTGGYTFFDKSINNRCNLLDKKLIENGCKPGNLKLILLTHGDVDHVSNCRFVKEKYGAKIAIHKDDNYLVKDLSVDKIFHNFKFNSFGLKLISKLINPLFVKICKKIIAEYNEFEVDYLIDNEFNLKPYNLNAEILHLPGHTNGSIGVLLDNGSLIVGDTLTNAKKPGISMNANNFKHLKDSVVALKEKSITMVYPGHGNHFSFADLKI